VVGACGRTSQSSESILNPDQHDGAKYTKTKYAKPERTSMLTNFFYTKPSAASSSNNSNGLAVDSNGLAAESSVLDPIKIQTCMALHFGSIAATRSYRRVSQP
jgi:hypothetical protein